MIYSDVVERYEDIHYPIEVPSVGEVIQDALNTADMTVEQLSKQIGVDLCQINDYICNNTKPAPEIAQRICQALDIKLIEII